MPLIVEDGTHVAGANSYASVDTVDAYHTARANTAWTSITDATTKEAAILRAMVYLEGLSWNGVKATNAQILEWPRGWIEDRNGYPVSTSVVPTHVVHALCEVALRELQAAGSTLPDTGRDEILSSIDVAGAIKMSWSNAAPTRPDYPVVKMLLKGLIQSSGGVRLMV